MMTPKLKPRQAVSSKRDYGHALIIGGSKGMMGAANIAAKAATRSGVGLLTVCIPEEERSILQCAVPEAMLIFREEENLVLGKYSAIGIGPGMGTDGPSKNLLDNILNTVNQPLILDADAITILANNAQLMKKIPKKTIITPHAGEFDRLFGHHTSRDERLKTAAVKAKKHNLIIVLKGHRTAIVSPSKIALNSTGNSGLAKGGAGDALTGIITSLLAQGYEPFDATSLGVYLHGLAADITLKKQSEESMIIEDVINNLGKAFKAMRK